MRNGRVRSTTMRVLRLDHNDRAWSGRKIRQGWMREAVGSVAGLSDGSGHCCLQNELWICLGLA